MSRFRELRAFGIALTLLGCASADGTSNAASSAPIVVVTSASGDLVVSAHALPEQPPTHGVLTVALDIAESRSGAPVDGLLLAATPWMPAHGHGTSVAPTVTANGGGHYTLANVALYMPGTWQIRIDVHGPREDHVDVDLAVR